MRLTEEEYQALIGGTPPKKSKYKNNKAEYKGLRFDSEGERDYYIGLLLRQRAGQIRDLKRQVNIEIQPSFTDSKGNKIRAINYKADFVYFDLTDNKEHIVDYKGFKTEVYQLKKKLLLYKGIEIEEVNV